MPSPEVLHSFQEGVKTIQQAEDFATLRQTIDHMISICPPEELPLAKDAIARVVRAKQTVELNNYQGYPQVLEELDKKYRDLYIVLRTANSRVAPKFKHQALPSGAGQPSRNQMARPMPLGGLNMPSIILNWLRSKRKYLIAGGAVGAVGGAYLLYKQISSDKKEEPEKESNFDKTIRSIQKYKAFSSMMNDPNFSAGDYNDLINGNFKKPKKKKAIKKEEAPKSLEWDKDERSLMKDMDEAFTAISTKPELDYQLPQLPAPKAIDPKDVIGEDKPIELEIKADSKRKKRDIPSKPKRRKKRVKKQKKESATSDSNSSAEVPSASTVPEKDKPKKVKKTKKVSTDDTTGRLIPIVKRTKRVRKVKA